MSDYIPIEVISEILCRLPVTPLLKFRCVDPKCKALIDSPMFVKKHLERSLKLKGADENSMLKLCGSYIWGDLPFGLFDYRTDFLSTRELWESRTDCYPFLNHRGGCPDCVMGCCNGLFLVNCACFESALWNPSTRKSIILPTIRRKPTMYIPIFLHCDCGFGYDKLSDDYKVLRIVPPGDTYLDFPGKTVVYSLNLNSYRQIKDFPYIITQKTGGIFVFGALHWFVYNPTDVYAAMVVAFDLGSEEYELVPLPLNLGSPITLDLAVFEDRLSMSCIYKAKADIWLMRERGNRDSWSKFLSLDVADDASIVPISYSRNSKYVILGKDNTHFLCYDLHLKLVRTISCKIIAPTFLPYLFSGSLVPLKKMEQEETKKRDDSLEGFNDLKITVKDDIDLRD